LTAGAFNRRPAAARKSNFIFLIAHDHRWDAMGAVQREHGEKGRDLE
jgi:hypothetical protein